MRGRGRGRLFSTWPFLPQAPTLINQRVSRAFWARCRLRDARPRRKAAPACGETRTTATGSPHGGVNCPPLDASHIQAMALQPQSYMTRAALLHGNPLEQSRLFIAWTQNFASCLLWELHGGATNDSIPLAAVHASCSAARSSSWTLRRKEDKPSICSFPVSGPASHPAGCRLRNNRPAPDPLLRACLRLLHDMR